MNLQNERIRQLCTTLKLEKIAADWPSLAARAVEQDATLADFLEELLVSEHDARNERMSSDTQSYALRRHPVLRTTV